LALEPAGFAGLIWRHGTMAAADRGMGVHKALYRRRFRPF